MIFLILTVILITSLFLIFKWFDVFKINTFQAIVVNYWVCIITGSLFLDSTILKSIEWNWEWGKLGLILGIGFIATFYMMALAAQKVSVSLSSLASKMSLVIPVLISLFVFEGNEYSVLNYIGLALSLVAIALSSINTNNETNKENRFYYFLIPLIFICSGTLDTILNYSNNFLETDTETRVFPILIFGTACFVGSFVVIYQMIFKKQKIELKSIIGGITLGIPNYFSIYFLLKTLQHYNNNGALVYPILNISIILLSTLSAIVFFKEKLSTIKKMGVILAILSILLLLKIQDIENNIFFN